MLRGRNRNSLRNNIERRGFYLILPPVPCRRREFFVRRETDSSPRAMHRRAPNARSSASFTAVHSVHHGLRTAGRSLAGIKETGEFLRYGGGRRRMLSRHLLSLTRSSESSEFAIVAHGHRTLFGNESSLLAISKMGQPYRSACLSLDSRLGLYSPSESTPLSGSLSCSVRNSLPGHEMNAGIPPGSPKALPFSGTREAGGACNSPLLATKRASRFGWLRGGLSRYARRRIPQS